MINILYVDDEPDLREVACMVLELDEDILVRDCGSGAEALALLQGWEPDLVLLDVMMPEMDGPATYAAIRKLQYEMRVVFITARANEEDQRGLLALRAAGVISKPFDPMTLAEQVRSFITRDHLENKLAPLRARFRQRLHVNRAEIRDSAAEQTIDAAQEAGRTAHKIAGLAGSLGYAELLICAKSLDWLAAETPKNVFASPEYQHFIYQVDRILADNPSG